LIEFIMTDDAGAKPATDPVSSGYTENCFMLYHGEHVLTAFETDPELAATMAGRSTIWPGDDGLSRSWPGVDNLAGAHRRNLICASPKLVQFLKYWVGGDSISASTVKLLRYVTVMKMENKKRKSAKTSPRFTHTRKQFANLIQRFLTVGLPHEWLCREFKAVRTAHIRVSFLLTVVEYSSYLARQSLLYSMPGSNYWLKLPAAH
jgi:hypothetical protein